MWERWLSGDDVERSIKAVEEIVGGPLSRKPNEAGLPGKAEELLPGDEADDLLQIYMLATKGGGRDVGVGSCLYKYYKFIRGRVHWLFFKPHTALLAMPP